ncbi:DUF2059 domain-containing protein [Roseivivax sediminis]|uniref:DUF2059 domain-containing protein n=1 Tax=Roseivivax sediminis TaxID=936889 RepID=A0A1I1YXN2_9RHOB|nr:DUF2059 domain-containing protein [Roseivivax sediminis]SFE23748.1 hypothetical protein SAMN04515678_107246 [Roseivivax sediminis]
MLPRLTLVLPFALAALPASAAPVDTLLDALGVERVVEVMREEGLAYTDTLAGDMQLSGSGWTETAERIYDTDRMGRIVRSAFDEGLDQSEIEPLIAFFESELGARVVTLEIEARETMIDPAAEEAARESYREVEGTDDARLGQIERFVASGDLVEQNVSGALNASLAFYNGLAAGGAMDIPEEDILRDVWAQEPETRADTTEWLHAYLMLAYEPLTDAELDRYIDLSESAAGEAVNRTLFEGFNAMYNEISYALGLAAAREMSGTEL